MNNVAHTEPKRPSKSSERRPKLSAAVIAENGLSDTGERAVAERETRTPGDRIRQQVAWIMLAQQQREQGHDERACDLEIVGALEHLSALSIELDDESSVADRTPSSGQVHLAEQPMVLLRDVERAVSEIEGLQEQCWEGLDQAIVAHTYVAGACGGDCSCNYVVDPHRHRFTEGVASVRSALECINGFLRELKPVNAPNHLDAAAEE